MRLIDADALGQFLADNYGYQVIDILGDIATFPTIDAVPVARCKDCIYNETDSCLNGEAHDPCYRPDYFCADGERRDNVDLRVSD